MCESCRYFHDYYALPNSGREEPNLGISREDCLHEDRECGVCNDCGEYVGTGLKEYEVDHER